MRRLSIVLRSLAACSLLAAFAAAQQPLKLPPKAQPGLKTPKEKQSYAIGLNIGMNMKRGEIQVDVVALSRGLADALNGATPALSEKEIGDALAAFEAEMRAQQVKKMEELAAKQKEQGAKNSQEGPAFLAANKKKEGIVETKSGLQYKVLKEGTGPNPKPTDIVTTNYRGTLIDGTEFDASNGSPISFPVNGVIKGWTEALQLMKVGSKYQLFVPAELAYGARGAGEKIGPNSVLIFEVELLGVKPGDAASE